MERIRQALEKQGLPPQTVETLGTGFVMTMRLPETDTRAPVNAPVNAPVKISELQREICSLIEKNKDATYDEIAQIVGKNRTTVMRNIADLKEKGIIRRVGPDKGGHWEVVKSEG